MTALAPEMLRYLTHEASASINATVMDFAGATRAPCVAHFEAVADGFPDLTPTLQRLDPDGAADWSGDTASGTYTTTLDTSADIAWRATNVQVGTATDQRLWHQGEDPGIAVWLDGDGNLVASAGVGTETGQTNGSAVVKVDREFIQNLAVDIELTFRVSDGALRLTVYDREMGKVSASDYQAFLEPQPASVLDEIFETVTTGAIYDMTDAANLAPNADGTGTITGGDEVLHIKDLSGKGVNATQDTAGLGGVYNSNGYLEVGGAAQSEFYSLETGKDIATRDGITVAVTMHLDTWGGAMNGDAVFFASYETNDSALRGRVSVHGRYGDVAMQGTPTDTGGLYIHMARPKFSPTLMSRLVYTWDVVNGTIKVFRDGVSILEQAVTAYPGGFASADSLAVKLFDAFSSEPLDGKIYKMVLLDRAVTDAEAATIDDFLKVETVTKPTTWADSGAAGVGTVNTAARSGFPANDFTGTMDGVEVWEGADQIPEGWLVADTPVNYDAEMHMLHYFWNFGDPHSTWQYLENVPEDFSDPNHAYGKFASHVFQQEGAYTVTCDIVQVLSAKPLVTRSARATYEITVGPRLDIPVDPTGLFDATNTIVMSKGDFTGAPAGIQVTHGPNGTADWLDAVDQIHEHPSYDRQATPIRILVKRGETGIENSVFEYWKVARGAGAGSVESKGRCDYIYVGTWGEGANPQVRVLSESNNAIQADRKAHAVIIDGIDVIGTRDMVAWNDPVDYTGTDGIHAFMAGDGFDQSFLVTGCRFTDRHAMGWHMADFGGTGDVSYCFNDCALDGITDWGVLGGSNTDRDGYTRIALLGMRFTDPADVPRYGDFNTPAGNDGEPANAPIRISELNGHLILDGIDCFARFGWSYGGSWEDGTERPATQALFRLSIGRRQSLQTKVCISRVAAEHDGRALSFNDSGSGRRLPGFGNVVIENVYHLVPPGGYSRGTIDAWGWNITSRNILTVFPDLPTDIGAGVVRNYDNEGIDGQRFLVLNDYNNTVVHLADTDALVDVSSNGLGRAVIQNSVIYTPQIADQSDHVDLAPSDPTILFAPRHQGRWEGSDGSLQTQFAIPPGTAKLYTPGPGSAVRGSATGEYLALTPRGITGRARRVWVQSTKGAVE